jgi:hypothetical protein
MAIVRSTYDEYDEIAAPGTPAANKVRVYGKTGGNSLFLKDSTGTEVDLGPGMVSSIRETITQAAHGFVVGDTLRRQSGSYTKALADTEANSEETVGVVMSVTDVNTFVLVYRGGITGLSGLTDGALYYLSAATAGLLTVTAPTTPVTAVKKPVLVATSTTTGIVLNQVGQPINDISGDMARMFSTMGA